jgi:hypothetical protein
MIDLDKVLDEYANKVGGKVIPYTDSQSVLTIPTSKGRFQSVIGWSKMMKDYKFLEFDSKVCKYDSSLDLKKVLEESSHYTFARLVIKDEYLQVAAAVIVEHATEDLIYDMVREVAETADDLEDRITGRDEN